MDSIARNTKPYAQVFMSTFPDQSTDGRQRAVRFFLCGAQVDRPVMLLSAKGRKGTAESRVRTDGIAYDRAVAAVAHTIKPTA